MLGASTRGASRQFAFASFALFVLACDRISEIDVLVPKEASAVVIDAQEPSERPVATDSDTDDGCGPGCDDASPACIDSSSYPGGGIHKASFTDVSDMTLNLGAAAIDGGVLRVVSVTGNERGSAYFTAPVPFDGQTSVYAHFAVRISGGAGAMGTDGMAFVLQSSPTGPAAIGVAGGGMGYKTVTPSVEIELDTFFNPATDPNGNHVALMAHGDDLVHVAYATPTFRLNDGVVRNVWVDYDASQKLLEVYMSDTPARPRVALLSHSGFDFGAELGNQVYVGFAAATGESKNDHDVTGEAWFVTSPLPKCR